MYLILHLSVVDNNKEAPARLVPAKKLSTSARHSAAQKDEKRGSPPLSFLRSSLFKKVWGDKFPIYSTFHNFVIKNNKHSQKRSIQKRAHAKGKSKISHPSLFNLTICAFCHFFFYFFTKKRRERQRAPPHPMVWLSQGVSH